MFKYEQEMLRIEQDAFITQLNWQKNQRYPKTTVS